MHYRLDPIRAVQFCPVLSFSPFKSALPLPLYPLYSPQVTPYCRWGDAKQSIKSKQIKSNQMKTSLTSSVVAISRKDESKSLCNTRN